MVQNSERVRSKAEIDADIERLREWLKKQPHLPHEVEEDMLRAYVCGTKSLEIAKEKLDNWFCLRGRVPELFSPEARDPFSQKFRDGSKALDIFFLPRLTPESYLVLWVKIGKDFAYFDHTQKITRALMMAELAMATYPENKGLVCVYDLLGIPSNIMSKLSLSMTAASLQWMQGTIPYKAKKVYIINSFPVVDLIMNTFIKPFLKTKIYERIVVTSGGVSKVEETLPKEYLPSDYGGSEKSSELLAADWAKRMEDKADWFKKIARLVADESKRPADAGATYGLNGTFRSLALD